MPRIITFSISSESHYDTNQVITLMEGWVNPECGKEEMKWELGAQPCTETTQRVM